MLIRLSRQPQNLDTLSIFSGGDGWASTVEARLEFHMGSGNLLQSKYSHYYISIYFSYYSIILIIVIVNHINFVLSIDLGYQTCML